MTAADASPDVVVIGAGAAGLAAAATLGRCGWDVAVLGRAEDRANATAAEVHNLPYAEGVAPVDLYAAMDAQLERLGVARVAGVADSIDLDTPDGRIAVRSGSGHLTCDRLVLAHGVDLDVPEWVPAGTWGNSVFDCPFCHAYEHRGQDFVVVGQGPSAVSSALLCTVHAATLTVVVSDASAADDDAAKRLRGGGGAVVVGSVAGARRLTADRLELSLGDGTRIEAGAILLTDILFMRTTLTDQLGLATDDYGMPQIDDDGRSSHPRIWVAGTAARPRHMLAEAMSSGIRAGVSIHQDICLSGL